jgi:hypothetical protein
MVDGWVEGAGRSRCGMRRLQQLRKTQHYRVSAKSVMSVTLQPFPVVSGASLDSFFMALDKPPSCH